MLAMGVQPAAMPGAHFSEAYFASPNPNPPADVAAPAAPEHVA